MANDPFKEISLMKKTLIMAFSLLLIVALIPFVFSYYNLFQEPSSMNNVETCNEQAMLNSTNKGYFGSVEGISYIVSEGIKRPGSEIIFSVYKIGSKIPQNYLIKVELHKVKDNKCIKITENTNILEYILPNEYDVKYIIYAKLVNKYNDKDILDAMLSYVNVPSPSFLSEFNVKLQLEKSTYHRWESLKFYIINSGIHFIYFGAEYEIYYFNGTNWIFADWLVPKGWIMPLYGLQPNSTRSDNIFLNYAIPGKYKLIKEVFNEEFGYKEILEANFEVIE